MVLVETKFTDLSRVASWSTRLCCPWRMCYRRLYFVNFRKVFKLEALRLIMTEHLLHLVLSVLHIAYSIRAEHFFDISCMS